MTAGQEGKCGGSAAGAAITAAGSGGSIDPGSWARIADILGLAPLPEEGGLYRQMWADGSSTAIYYLLAGVDFSAVHRLPAAEVYHHYAGAPLLLLLLDEAGGGYSEPILGPDIAGGQRPQLVVPAGTWQGSSPLGSWCLVGTTMAPPFDRSGFELGIREELCARFPAVASRITALTR